MGSCNLCGNSVSCLDGVVEKIDMTKEDAIKSLLQIDCPENIREVAESVLIQIAMKEPCEDCINREAAINVLLQLGDYYYGNEEAKRGISMAECEIYELPSVQSKAEWIPCSKRLPKKERRYLVTTRQGSVEVALFRPTSDLKGDRVYWKYANCYPINEHTVAWLSSPLPEPYKEKE